MTHVETIAIHFVGYNLLHGAVKETTGSLALIRDLSASTGRSMAQWNLAVLQSTNAVAEAHARYAKIVAGSGAAVVDSAHEQALAYMRLEGAYTAVTAATIRQSRAEADLALIQSRVGLDATVAARMMESANVRLAAALGDRAIAERGAAIAAAELAQADRVAGNVAAEEAVKQQIAAAEIVVAEERKAAAAQGAAAAQVAAFRTASAAAMGVGAALLIGAGIATVALGVATSKASDFRSQMLLLHTQARVSLDQINNELTPAILNMAGAVGFSATELSSALFYMESEAGGAYTTSNALKLLEAAAKGAAVGHSNLDATAKALAATMQVFPQIVGGAAGAMGVLDAIVGQGMMTMEDLNGALRTGVLLTLKSAGIGLVEFGGALATMTDFAIPAVQAANALRMAIYLMTAPTGASDKVLKGLGLTTKELSSISKEWTDKLEGMGIRHAKLADDLSKPNGIVLAMKDLRTHMEAAGLSASGQAEVIYKAFGGGKMGKAVLSLYENITGGAGASVETLKKLGFTEAEVALLTDRLEVKTQAIGKQIGFLGINFKLLKEQDPSLMWKMFTSSVNALIITLGTAFIPILIGILHFITPVTQAIGDWITKHQGLTTAILGGILVFTTIFGGAMLVVGALGMIASAFVAIATAPAFVFPAAAAFFVGLTALAVIFTGAVWLVSNAWGSMAGFWDSRVVPAGKRLWNSIQSVWTLIQNGLAIVKPLFDDAFGDFAKRLTEHGGLWDNATKAFQDFSSNVVTFIKSPTFATLIADFSVALPVALGLAFDAMIVFADAAQIAFTAISGTALIAFYQMTFQLNKIPGVVKDTATEIARLTGRLTDDLDKEGKDAQKIVDGTYQKMWQDVYDETMYMTAKIGKDGAIKIENAGGTWANAARKTGVQMNDAGTYIGDQLVLGIMHGLDQHEKALHAQTEQIVSRTVGVARGAGIITSPSKLMATAVGTPLVQGIEMGMEAQAPAMYKTFSALVVGLADTAVKSPTVETTAPAQTVKQVGQPQDKNESYLKEIAMGIAKLIENKHTGPTTGIEALIYEITRRVDEQRNRGQKGYRP